MSTKSEQFSAKIRNLTDYQNRILHNIAPLPTGTDIANTLRYFIHTLRSILKEAPADLGDVKHSARRRLNPRLPHYPSLDYLCLYETLDSLIEIVPSVQYGQSDLGQAIQQLFGCILWFLEPEIVDTIPHTVASTLAIFPAALQKETVDLLCTTLLPICLSEVQSIEGDTYASMSVSAVIMLVLQHCKNKAHHAQLMECIMTYKKDVYKDILCTIAFGPSSARGAAANLLFHYWPSLVPANVEDRDFSYTCWKPIMCQRSNCLSPVNNAAVKMCMDPVIAGKYSKHPPPLYLCQVCSDYVNREISDCKPFLNVLQPQEIVSKICENKNCSSMDKTALFTCYSSECTGYHGNRPIRYCTSCNSYIHADRKDHIIQDFPADPLSCDKETQSYLCEAIISLLKEAHVIEKDPLMAAAEAETNTDALSQPSENEVLDLEGGEGDSRLLSRFGLWLLIEKCNPTERTPDEVVGRLLSMAFQWFGFTATLTQDSVALESLKADYVTKWLMKILKSHFNVFVSCLLPQPPDYARVGGDYDSLCSRITELLGGLRKVFSLTPYNAVTFEVWDYIMPHWMECICCDIPDEELSQLQDVLCRLFDVDMSPLPFSTEKLFNFVACRFRGMAANDQEKALLWLQILTETDIVIPLKLLLSIFSDGLTSMSKIQLAKQKQRDQQRAASQTAETPAGPEQQQQQQQQQAPDEVAVETPGAPPTEPTVAAAPPSVAPPAGAGPGTEGGVVVGGVPVEPPHVKIDPSPDDGPIQEQDEEQILRCFVLMLDMLNIQVDLQYLPFHQGMENSQSKDFVSLLTQTLSMTWLDPHRCTNPRGLGRFQQAPSGQPPTRALGPCPTCELWGIYFQLALKLLEHISPVSETKVCDMPEVSEYQFEKFLEDGLAKAKALNNDVKGKKNRMAERGSSKQKRFTKTKDPGKGFLSATEMKPVEVFTAETVKLPSAKDLKAEKEKAVKKATAGDKSAKGKKDGDNGSTKEARFKLEELPKSIQLLYVLLKEVPRQTDPDVLLNLFNCIKILVLNAECLRQAAKDHDAFLKYAQNNLLIPSFWNLLEGELSHVNEILVPLFLHSLALPHGSDAMWNLLQRDVESDDWKARFRAVERVTALLRFVEKKSLGNNSVIMCSLACAFSTLVAATDDICPAVSSRAMIMLETIPKKVIKVLVGCLEFQWDCVIEDRVMILNALYKLQHFLSDMIILSWEFFMNRLDTLALEAHVEMEQNKEFPFPIDLSRSQAGAGDRMDTFLNKQTRARVARSQSETNSSLKPRCLSSFNLKSDFKRRSMSSPATTNGFSRIQFAPTIRSTYSRLSESSEQSVGPLGDALFDDGHLQTVQEEQPADIPPMDLSSLDKETVHKLISLLMKFMTRESSADEEQTSGRAMNSVKGRNMMRKSTVLRHLSVLMGYNQVEKCFILAPQQLRESAVFYAFMAGAPKMLDHNVKVGNILLPMIMELFAYSPSPQKSPQDMQPHDYTLWFLEPHCRHSWLMSVLIILYKYNFDQLELKAEVKSLMRITINTLEAQRHQCKPKRPEPPSPEDIWGATTPLEKKRSESSLIQAVGEGEEQDNGEEVSSNASAGPSSPLIPVAPREIPAGLHQQVECEPDMLFVPEEEVTALPIKKSNLSFVASTIVEVEEENEESVEALEPLNKVEAIPAKALMVSKEEPVSVQAVPRVVTEMAKVERQALEPSLMSAKVESFFSPFEKSKLQPRFRSKKQRKMGVATISSNALSQRIDNKLGGGGKQGELSLDLSAAGAGGGINAGITKGGLTRKSKEKGKKRSQKLKEQAKTPEKKSSVYSAAKRYHEDKNFMALTKCTDCGVLLEEYDDDTVSLAIVVLSALVHRDPELAAPLLLEMLQVVARIASGIFSPWQAESIGSPPGHCCTVAKQFLRCTLHQLAPNGIFPQLFLSKIEDGDFLKTMAVALTDFSDLSPLDAVSFLLEGLNEKKTLPSLRILLVLMNLAEYMENLPLEGSSAWGNLISLFETFFRKLAFALPESCDTNDLFRIMIVILKSPATKTLSTLLDPMTKLISYVIQNCHFKLKLLIEVCTLCNRIFVKERERQSVARCLVMEFVNALKFKSSLPDINLIQLVQFICLDAGGKMSDFGNLVGGDGDISDACMAELSSSSLANDCLKQYLNDAIEYVGDLHTLTKVKDKMKGGSHQNLNEDTLGSQLKAGVAQIIALEFTRSNQRDSTKAVNRYLPWLYHPPSAVQQGPKEFIDCIAHVRLLSWLLLGSLTHAAVCPINSSVTGIVCHPIPLDAGNHIADHVQVILAGFAEQSKASVLHMSSLFHAFILCQLWTMYCEQMASINPPQSDQHNTAMMSVMDFWGRVTPGVLQLLSHSKVLADMVNLHFLSLMEALQECNSSVLTKLFPMWTSILFSYPSKLPGSLQVRLQNCENWAPPSLTKGEVTTYHSSVLLKWLKRLQFKMGQIEIQSSAAAQFYTV
ncbi:protein unc-79 homolog isoform X2 [Acanthaster planci]|uniref:Protein unc-79 homolog isoform X2 n=1 Tax=Acanthaster planci TaxID=133434 RepID=A0A8B7Z7Y8_ACAPL|nr:protein unc-79 homolog isoform X2 [Acanthaster planci]